MNLSKKIAAALDENTQGLRLAVLRHGRGRPNRFTLNLTALDSVGVAFDNAGVRHDRAARTGRPTP